MLQRPGTLGAEEKAASRAAALEFDAAGNFVQAWGGPGAGYEWPNSEHGVYVDPKGFVWIGGNGDERPPDPQVHEGRQVRHADRPRGARARATPTRRT